MINPTYNGVLLAQSGNAVLSGDAQADVMTYPRAKGVLIRPSNIKQATLVLNCELVLAGDSDSKENQQHLLNEKLLSIASGTVAFDGLSIENCVPESVSFNEVKNRSNYYTITFAVGTQNTYTSLPNVTYNQLSNPADLGGFRYGTFAIDDMEPFYFGQRIDQLKSAKYTVIRKQKESWAYEYDVKMIGGVETIKLTGWIVDTGREALQSFIYNAIFGPLGKMGTLTAGTDATTYAFFQSIEMQSIIQGSMYWTATFLSTLKC